MCDIPPAREEGDEVARRPSRPKLQYAGSETDVIPPARRDRAHTRRLAAAIPSSSTPAASALGARGHVVPWLWWICRGRCRRDPLPQIWDRPERLDATIGLTVRMNVPDVANHARSPAPAFSVSRCRLQRAHARPRRGASNGATIAAVRKCLRSMLASHDFGLRTGNRPQSHITI